MSLQYSVLFSPLFLIKLLRISMPLLFYSSFSQSLADTPSNQQSIWIILGYFRIFKILLMDLSHCYINVCWYHWCCNRSQEREDTFLNREKKNKGIKLWENWGSEVQCLAQGHKAKEQSRIWTQAVWLQNTLNCQNVLQALI